MKRKTILSDYIDYNFSLIAICTEDEDFKICWKLNKLFSFDFARQSDLEITYGSGKKQGRFPVFSFLDEDLGLHYYLISNRNNSFSLVPEHKKVDYFLKITGEQEWVNMDEIIKKIRTISTVKMAFPINPVDLTKGDNLIF